MRESLIRLKPKGAGKLHWRQMTTRDKRKTIQVIGNLDETPFVVVAEPVSHVLSEERARRKCLEVLLFILERQGVDRYVLESRTVAQDRKDMQCLAYLRTSHQLRSIRLDHVRGADEPCLWLPDQILGAYGDSRAMELDFSDFLEQHVLDEIVMY